VDIRTHSFNPDSRLWNEDGHSVETHVPSFGDGDMEEDQAGHTYCGIFWDSNHVKDSFSYVAHHPPGDEVDENRRSVTTKHYKYPMCNSKEICNVQACGPPSCYRPVIDQTNEEVLGSWIERGEQAEGLERGPALQVESFQAYNTISHKMRRDKDLHDASKGIVTSALAGPMTRSAIHRRRFKKLVDLCDINLPHVKFEHKLTSDRFSKSIRLELVIIINMYAIHPDDRNGR
jgi:hypothetical protein